jgi:hypothetical protein
VDCHDFYYYSDTATVVGSVSQGDNNAKELHELCTTLHEKDPEKYGILPAAG